MRLMVLSDSHASLRFMKSAIEALKPDKVLHLGDYYEDGQALAEMYPNIQFYLVPGNCDAHRMGSLEPWALCPSFEGVRCYMTHGHNHRVKLTLSMLLADARAAGAQAVFYGHTHKPDCHWEEGFLVLNPGSCGHSGASVGLLEIRAGRIEACSILSHQDWEEQR